jgi:hypothetical protein
MRLRIAVKRSANEKEVKNSLGLKDLKKYLVLKLIEGLAFLYFSR